MPAEIYNDFDLKKASPLDSRLAPLSLIADLPNPMTPSNFLFLGATIYVEEDNSNYRVEEDPSNPGILIWVKQSSAGLVTGTLNITPLTTNLDLNLVSPDISLCDSVLVNIVGGTTALVDVITNFPANVKLTFFTGVGQTLTFNHTDYTSANTGKIVLEDGFDMNLKGRTVGNESLTLEKQDTAIVQVSATQFIKTADWVSTVLSLVVEDSLTSTSINTALSANQGKILNDTKQNNLTVTPDERIDLTNDIITIKPYSKNEIPLIWSNADISSAAADMPAFLASLYAGGFGAIAYNIQHEDRYVNATVEKGLSLNKPLDFGKWLLPAGLASDVESNWFNIEQPTKVLVGHYGLDSGTNLPLVEGAALHAVKFNRSNVVGDLDKYFDFDSVIGTNYAYSFKPKWVEGVIGSTFEIEYICKFYSSSETQPAFYINLVKSPNVITNSDLSSYPTSFSPLEAAYSMTGTYTSAGTQIFQLTVKKVVTFTTPEAITCYLGTAYGFNSTFSTYGGSLTIKKLS